MAKTLYEAYRLGKNGGERWVGTVHANGKPGRAETGGDKDVSGQVRVRKVPYGGSAFARPTK